MALGAVLKRGQDVIRKSHGDDIAIVQDKLTNVEQRYSGQYIQARCPTCAVLL